MGMGTPRVYVTEISLPNMRGVIAVFTILSLSFGLTLQALLGSSFKWNELCLSYGVFSAVISISSLLLPETPYYVLIKSTQNEAEKVLKRFRGAEYNTRNEITEMMDFKATNNISGLTFGTQIKLFVTRAVCLPFWIVIGYSVVTQLSGTSIIFVWTVDFLQASKVSFDSGSAHFFMELVRLGMGVVSAILMYKIGRRPQALISSLGVTVMCFVLGFLLLYNHSVTIYPFICYLLYVTFSTLGYYTLPFVMMYELYPLQVRGVLGGLTNSIINFMVFGVNAAFPFFRDLVGHAYILISFAMASILGTVFLFFCLPETKDLTLQEIEEYFNDLRPTLVSQRSVIAAQRSQLLTQTLESNALRSRSTLDLTLSKAAGRKPLN
ncbi:unnamed protein product [Chilo suppressalis]|uniref:Major facilitator superfamily (MFS) profile domain-containing protein n=1 Tax=Chilo suppressalis TaxID=168631 RepID=A0ABN8BFF5_CHISP|nr:unnamed protein product [Chilo suppressalis]